MFLFLAKKYYSLNKGLPVRTLKNSAFICIWICILYLLQSTVISDLSSFFSLYLWRSFKKGEDVVYLWLGRLCNPALGHCGYTQ